MRRVLSCLSLALAGCLVSGCALTSVAPSSTPGVALSGTIHGGQQTIAGARIYLMAVGTTGYGTASTSLLTLGTAGTDSVGGYVLSSAHGDFGITGDYVCTAGQQVYLLALGGDPTGAANGTINNTGIGMMTALGACPTGGTFALNMPHVSINELTTVAAAYALAGFATDATHISSSGTTQANTGVANAFRTAANLVSPVNGNAYAITPTGGGRAPQTEINSLGDILAACINTPASTSANCAQLFTLAQSAGATGTKPTDTASAVINIAHYPAANPAGLYALAPGTGTPFQPSLTAAPNDFSVGIVWNFNPNQIAFDSAGNLWGANIGLVEYSNSGALLSPAAGFTGGGVNPTSTGGSVNSVAIDPFNNVWVTTEAAVLSQTSFLSNNLSKFSNTGVPLSPSTGFTGGGLTQPFYIAIDGTGNVFAGNTGTTSVSKFTNAGVPFANSPIATAGSSDVGSLAIDNASNLWVGSHVSNGTTSVFSLTELSNTGALITRPAFAASNNYDNLSIDASNNLWGTLYNAANSNQIFKLQPTTGLPAAGFPLTGNTAIQQCLTTQIDGDGKFWCASDDDSIAALTSTGAPLSPANGYIVPNLQGPQWMAIDNSGNVWTAGDYAFFNNVFNTYTVELVGAAAPVITPMSLAIQQGKVGARP